MEEGQEVPADKNGIAKKAAGEDPPETKRERTERLERQIRKTVEHFLHPKERGARLPFLRLAVATEEEVRIPRAQVEAVGIDRFVRLVMEEEARNPGRFQGPGFIASSW